jgi:uncharacterized protein YidB (DUF937 family)
MARGLPSMTALLGLLAVAGYQNRDKLAEMLGGARRDGDQRDPADPNARSPQSQTGGGVGGILSGGLGDLIERFRQSGEGETADSWVRTGPNREVSPAQLERALGPDVITSLQKETGLSRDELLSRLSRNLPEAVDKYTPEGRLPADDDR